MIIILPERTAFSREFGTNKGEGEGKKEGIKGY